MYINAVSSINYPEKKYQKQNTFRSLIVDNSAYRVINHMSQADFLEFYKIKNKLARTKFWDLKISSLKNKMQEFRFHFLDKTKKHGVISDGIYPYHINKNEIRVYSIIYGSENISKNLVETLKFNSAERAEEVYNQYRDNLEYARLRSFNVSPLESLKSKVIELNMLEEASNYTEVTDKLEYLDVAGTEKRTVGNKLKKKF
jgi:hypothetical protein